MSELQCRLCSSPERLISLFSGKCRMMRDYIRKLVALRTGIKFEKNDPYRCICLKCISLIYNFHIFTTCCLKNEEKLQNIAKETTDYCAPNKAIVREVDEIVLPDVKELIEDLAPWLEGKIKYIINGEIEECAEKEKDDVTNVAPVSRSTADSYTQYHTIAKHEKETQCQPNNEARCTQTYNTSETKSVKNQDRLLKHFRKKTHSETRVAKSSQTENIATKSVRSQCTLINSKSSKTTLCNKETQYQTLMEEPTQTNNCLQKVGKATNDKNIPVERNTLLSVERSTKTHNVKEVFRQLKMSHKYTQCELLSKSQFNHKIQPIETCKDSMMKSVKSQCRLLVSPVCVVNRNSSTQTDLANNDFNSKDMDTKLSIKIDVKDESLSPFLLPTKYSDILGDNVENTTSTIENSPKSSHLLTLIDKVIIKTCKVCEKPLYTKNEVKTHMRTHMICSFCKKKFPSVKKTKQHCEKDCAVRNLMKTVPVITLMKLESLKDIQKRYPEVLKKIKGVMADGDKNCDTVGEVLPPNGETTRNSFLSCVTYLEKLSLVEVKSGQSLGAIKVPLEQTEVVNNKRTLNGHVDNKINLQKQLKDTDIKVSLPKKLKMSHS